MIRKSITLLTLFLATSTLAATPNDPFTSVIWDFVHQTHLDGAPVIHDERVLVTAPASAEDSMQLPVSVRWTGEEPIEVIRIIADLNPIMRVLSYEPLSAEPSLAIRMKVQQATIIRVAMRTADGVWHMNGTHVDAAGGGCTAPSMASNIASWEERYGELSAQVWPGDSGNDRLRIRIMHPMDTGLVNNIPRFILETLEVQDAHNGTPLARFTLHEPMAENPMISIDLKHAPNGYRIKARDVSGLEISGTVEPISRLPVALLTQFPMQ